MYGKLFTKMFEGSLYGKGWGPLLVMSYVIANGKPDRELGMVVELNPQAMADKFGEDVEEVAKAIRFLCSPDPDTSTPGEEGRRLIKLGTFSYQVVNGAKYRAIRDEEQRREQVREAMQRYRQKQNGKRPKAARQGGSMRERLEVNGNDHSTITEDAADAAGHDSITRGG